MLIAGKLQHVMVYAHYSREGSIPKYLSICLQRALEVVDRVVLVAAGEPVASLPTELLGRVELICRQNLGWDFASYRDGLLVARKYEPERLTLCNDSVYGPLFPLQEAFDAMEGRADAWGMTASSELWWHLQSYFLSFSPAVVAADAFWDFWVTVPNDATRRDVIRNGEIRLSQKLLDVGFLLESYCTPPPHGESFSGLQKIQRLFGTARKRWRDPMLYQDLMDVVARGARLGANPSLVYWPTLIGEQRLPFVKRAVVANPGGLDTLMYSMDRCTGGMCSDVLDVIREDVEYGL